MSRTWTAQKAGLTRALNSRDRNRIITELLRTRDEWDALRSWPDAWHRWNIASRDWAGCELDDLTTDDLSEA